MELLKKSIREKGSVKNSSLLKVDSFLNHQIDPTLMYEIGKEFKNVFMEKKVDKVLTIEASGIAVGIATAYSFNVPLVFAKKNKPSTMEDNYTTKVRSFTKNKEYDITISKEFIKKGERILIVDDFLAMGNAVLGLNKIVKEAGAEVVGVGIVIEKGFQEGRKFLEEANLCLKSLAIVKSLENNKIILK